MLHVHITGVFRAGCLIWYGCSWPLQTSRMHSKLWLFEQWISRSWPYGSVPFAGQEECACCQHFLKVHDIPSSERFAVAPESTKLLGFPSTGARLRRQHFCATWALCFCKYNSLSDMATVREKNDVQRTIWNYSNVRGPP